MILCAVNIAETLLYLTTKKWNENEKCLFSNTQEFLHNIFHNKF